MKTSHLKIILLATAWLSAGHFASAQLKVTSAGNVGIGKDEYLQNITINASKTYYGKTISAGYDVTTKKAVGPVLINNNTKVTLKAVEGTLLKNDVEVQLGSELEIK